MRSARSRAAAGGESKQGVVIALVIFVLISIVTAVVAYYGYADQADLRKRLAAAEARSAAREKERNQESYFKSFYKILAGYGEQDKENNRDDAGTMAGYRNEYANQLADEVRRVQEKFKFLNWDFAQDKPNVTLVARVAELDKEIAGLKEKLTDAENRVAMANKQKEQEVAKALEAENAFKKEIEDLNNKLAAVPNAKSKAFDDQVKANVAIRTQLEAVQRQMGEEIEKREKQITQLTKDNQNLVALSKKLEEKVVPVDLLNHDQAKGAITNIDRTGDIAFINLGSADRVKPELTFSIYPRGVKPQANPDTRGLRCPTCGAESRYWTKPVPGIDRKGALEIVEVLGPHLSKARITHAANAIRDPILPGDELYNPSWNPNFRERVVIAGKVDLTGDNVDNSAEFVRNLENQGIIIDAYLDPKDGTVKGNGLTAETSYLVIGSETPQLAEKMAELRNQAASLGVTVVPLRRFLALTGYRLPQASSAAARTYNGYPVDNPRPNNSGLPNGR